MDAAHRGKSIKKKTKTRLTLLRNLRKGKARQEPRCGFQQIPYPSKFVSASPVHHLYADVVLTERNNTIVSEASLFNHFKAYKSANIVDCQSQKVVKVKVEDKNVEMEDWRSVVEKIENSQIIESKEWAEWIRTYCERHETVIQELQREQRELTNERLQSLIEMNQRAEKTRQNIMKTYPCIEFKSQMINGQIQITEISASEKYLAEAGYTLENFASTVLTEGFPELTPLTSPGASSIAKLRLQRYLNLDYDGYQTPEFESCLLMKNGCKKKIRMKIHYHVCYEKGVFGFVFIGAIIAKQKPSMADVSLIGGGKMSNAFVEMMTYKEKEMNEFLSKYYNQAVEEKYSNIHKICRFKEIKS